MIQFDSIMFLFSSILKMSHKKIFIIKKPMFKKRKWNKEG